MKLSNLYETVTSGMVAAPPGSRPIIRIKKKENKKKSGLKKESYNQNYLDNTIKNHPTDRSINVPPYNVYTPVLDEAIGPIIKWAGKAIKKPVEAIANELSKQLPIDYSKPILDDKTFDRLGLDNLKEIIDIIAKSKTPPPNYDKRQFILNMVEAINNIKLRLTDEEKAKYLMAYRNNVIKTIDNIAYYIAKWYGKHKRADNILPYDIIYDDIGKHRFDRLLITFKEALEEENIAKARAAILTTCTSDKICNIMLNKITSNNLNEIIKEMENYTKSK